MRLKLILTLFTSMLFTVSAFAEETKKDCSQEKNLYKKIVCKTDNATSGITNKKTLADFFKKKK